MPYKVFKRDNKYCVYAHDAEGQAVGDSYGCHRTEEGAMEQMKALYANDESASKEATMCAPLFVDLALADGKAFDGVAPGTFTDMLGRRVTISQERLAEMVANTIEAINATRTESGETVGLPIDAKDHQNGDGAGWIIGAELHGGKVRLTPRWTEIGLSLISGGIRRFFSATIDLANNVILGGTLTNWPATRDGKGRIMLRPIELASPGLMYVESGAPAITPDKSKPKKSEVKMTWEELTQEQREELLTQARAAIAQESTANFSAVLEQERKRYKDEAEAAVNLAVARVRREREISDFAQAVTIKGKRGLPVKSEDVEKFVASLDDAQRAEAMRLLSLTVEKGLVEFSAVGSDAPLQSLVELDPYLAAKLDAGELKVADLSNPVLGLGDLARYNLSKWQGKENK